MLQDISTGKPSFEYGNSEKPNSFGNDSLQNVGREKISSLRNSITEIESLIEQRENLSKSLSEEVEKIKTDIENFLLKNIAVDSEDFKERNGLRQKQIEVSELQLNERVTCWKDVAMLKKELRECKKELSEKEER
ncbi:MAG: hypothetical protein ABFQ65_04310, partial [Nanoarchaeota archaeon]